MGLMGRLIFAISYRAASSHYDTIQRTGNANVERATEKNSTIKLINVSLSTPMKTQTCRKCEAIGLREYTDVCRTCYSLAPPENEQERMKIILSQIGHEYKV